MKILISNILLLFMLTGCNSEKQQSFASDTTMGHEAHHNKHTGDPHIAEVMAIHDSIMPAMGTIMTIKKKLTVELGTIDSLLAVKSTEVLKKRKEKALALHIQLDKADKDMMNWMHQYKADTLEKLGEQEARAYLADQKSKIEAVRDQTNSSIRDAQTFINKK